MIIENFLLPLQPFEIPIKGLKSGRSVYKWHADGGFFGTFENTEILAADLEIEVEVINEDYSIEVKGKIDGNVTVACDRCLGDLKIDIHTSFEDDEFEGCQVLDIGQDIYDFVCIALPMQRVHQEGECDEETAKFISK